jgi:conjugative transposon TraK protein
MFKRFKNIDDAFQQVRLLSLVAIIVSAAVSCWAIYSGFAHVARAEGRIYVLAGGKALEAVAADRKDNVPVEARDHIRSFHRWFFTLDPDELAIGANRDRALYLADGSARALYNDLKESGFIAGIISANISQSVDVDSIGLNLDVYPYVFHCRATERLVRATSVTTRSLVTQGYLRNVERTDNNPHGFLIERFEVVENKDLETKSRP